jgi:hypothetical protein
MTIYLSEPSEQSTSHAYPRTEQPNPPPTSPRLQQAAEQRGNLYASALMIKSVSLPFEMLALPIKRLQISCKSRIARFGIPAKPANDP